ncbi:hypothetical protein NL676_029461 [Syzygium grande]|nr:hypothetical protein NL676_029461 [Syzygium grande]
MAENPSSRLLASEPQASNSLVTGKHVSALPKHPSAVNVGSYDATRRSSSSVVFAKSKGQASISAVENPVARTSSGFDKLGTVISKANDPQGRRSRSRGRSRGRSMPNPSHSSLNVAGTSTE